MNRLRHRLRRRTQPGRAFVQDQIDRAKNWIHPPPKKPSMAELALRDRDELMMQARRNRHRWARGPLDPLVMAEPFRRM